jgi:hypothetical protein
MRNHFANGAHAARLQHFVAPHAEDRAFVDYFAAQNLCDRAAGFA